MCVYSSVAVNAKVLLHGCMHGNICDTHQVHDISELKQRPTNVWRG